VAAADIEGRLRGGRAEGLLDRHAGMVAVDDDPRAIRTAERRKLLCQVEAAAAVEQHLADEHEIVATAARRSEKAIGESVERLDGDTLERSGAGFFPARELPPRAVEFAVAGEETNRPGFGHRRHQ